MPDEPAVGTKTALVVASALGVLYLLVVPPTRALRRRMRLRGAAAEPRRLILVTNEQFTERAAGLGLGRELGRDLGGVPAESDGDRVSLGRSPRSI